MEEERNDKRKAKKRNLLWLFGVMMATKKISVRAEDGFGMFRKLLTRSLRETLSHF